MPKTRSQTLLENSLGWRTAPGVDESGLQLHYAPRLPVREFGPIWYGPMTMNHTGLFSRGKETPVSPR